MTWVDEQAPKLGMSKATIFAVQLCLEETLVNVVSYAFEPGTTHDVHVTLWRDGPMVLAEVTDEGRPFDPLAQKMPEPAKDLASAQLGGLGIKLLRSFTKRIAYRREGALNRLTMTFDGA